MAQIVANLHNTQTDRYHPILFRDSPMPGGAGPARHKSAGHHTVGFDTREEAIADCEALAGRCEAKLCIAKDFPWDGEGIPAMVVFFTERDGEVVPAF